MSTTPMLPSIASARQQVVGPDGRWTKDGLLLLQQLLNLTGQSTTTLVTVIDQAAAIAAQAETAGVDANYVAQAIADNDNGDGAAVPLQRLLTLIEEAVAQTARADVIARAELDELRALVAAGSPVGFGPELFDAAGAAAGVLATSLQKAANLADVASALSSRINLAAAGLADANVFTALNTYQAGAIYKTPIGTAQLIIDGTTLLQQVVMQIFDNGVSKWLFGKQADNSFFIFDQVQGRNLMMTDPATGALTLNAFTTVLGEFLIAAAGSQTDINGKTIRFYNCNASAAALVAGDNSGNVNALEITKAAAVVSCKFPNGAVTFTIAPVFTDQAGTRAALGLTAAAVATPAALTEATSAVLTITGGAAALLAACSIQVKLATTSQAGYLASADWNTFNGKQAALGYTPLNPANNLSDVTAATARTNLGLGTAATTAATAYDAAGAAAAVQALACLKANNLSDVTAATARTNLGVPALASANTFSLSVSNAFIEIFKNTNGVSGTNYGVQILAGSSSGDAAFQVSNAAGTNTILYARGDGLIGFGNAAPSYKISVTAGDVGTMTAGNGFRVKEGSNAKMGVSSAMVAGSLVVLNSSVTATSRIFVTSLGGGANIGALYVSAQSAGVSFTVKSTNASDTTTFNFLIFEPS